MGKNPLDFSNFRRSLFAMEKLKTFVPYVILFSAAFFAYMLIYTNSIFSITAINWFNSYSLQAYRWLQGYLDLGQNYQHLEIALFDGRYWISFPPFPSIIMLPFVWVLGSANTPDHFIALAVFLLAVMYAYKIALIQLKNRYYSVFFALFLCIGTNYLQISMRGIVWHMAQNLAFLLMLMAIYYALTNVRWHSFLSLFFLCCALGCRPLNILYSPVILFLIYRRENAGIFEFLKKIIVYGLPALTLGVFFLWLNYARFGSIFEFGHNFLPASMNAEHGQFSMAYMRNHLSIMFFRLPSQLPVFSEGVLFQPIAFWISSPIVISYVAYLAVSFRNVIIIKDATSYDRTFVFVFMILVPALILLHLLALSAHKDVGGPQFGYRYTIDILPALLLGLTSILGKLDIVKSVLLNTLPFSFGFILNVMATVDAIGPRW